MTDCWSYISSTEDQTEFNSVMRMCVTMTSDHNMTAVDFQNSLAGVVKNSLPKKVVLWV